MDRTDRTDWGYPTPNTQHLTLTPLRVVVVPEVAVALLLEEPVHVVVGIPARLLVAEAEHVRGRMAPVRRLGPLGARRAPAPVIIARVAGTAKDLLVLDVRSQEPIEPAAHHAAQVRTIRVHRIVRCRESKGPE